MREINTMNILKQFSRNEGYSFIEIFIVLIIVSLISTLLLVNSNKITSTINKGKENLQIKHDLIKLRIVLEKECQKIQPIWFSSSIPHEYNGNNIKIYYYNGDKDSYLEILKTVDFIQINHRDNILFYSEQINGNFSISNKYLGFTFKEYNFKFNFGVIIA